MKLNDYFKQFLGNISLNPTRIDRITSAVSTWESKFKSNANTKDLYIDFYIQGSFANDTAIKPQDDKEFDVDVILLLEFEESSTSTEALKLVSDTIKSYEDYKDNVTTKDRCVRINYAGEFHMDIVPAKETDDDYIEIPSKKENEWKETNPKGFTSWCKAIHSTNQYQFNKIVKIVKYWRDRKVGSETAPKSILLTTLLGSNIKSAASTAESLVLTLENLVKNIDDILVDDVPYVDNPSLEGENLARDWDKDKFDIFKKKLTKFAEDSRAALDEQNEDKSIELWQEIFGSKFPKKLSEAAQIASAVQNGNVFVNTAGILNRNEGNKIPNHRFFGE